MGLSSSLPSITQEIVGRTYRVLTKEELTVKIYSLCKNIVAKWCFPIRDPSSVTQSEINKYLDEVDFHSRKIKVNYDSYSTYYRNQERTFMIPYDFYLRGIFWYAEGKSEELNIGKNMDQVLFEDVLQTIYGDIALCVNKLIITKTDNGYVYKYNQLNETNLSDGNETAFFQTILNTYTKCRYGVILVTSLLKDATDSHRTLIYFENIENNLNIIYYDPHGSSSLSWSNKLRIYDRVKNIFEEQSTPYLQTFNIQTIRVNEYSKMCLLGIQAYSSGIDIGMCQIFSSLWLYTTLKVILEASKSAVILPSVENWINLIDEYYITMFDKKQRYNVMLLFASNLYNYYVEKTRRDGENIIRLLENYHKHLIERFEDKLSKYEITYERRIPEEIKRETDVYIVKTAQEGKRAYEEEQKRLKAESSLSDKQKRILGRKRRKEEMNYDKDEYKEYEKFEKRVKEEEKKEEPYYKSIRRLIPFGRNKKIFEQCSNSSECLSGCCYHNEIDNEFYCLDAEACQA